MTVDGNLSGCMGNCRKSFTTGSGVSSALLMSNLALEKTIMRNSRITVENKMAGTLSAKNVQILGHEED